MDRYSMKIINLTAISILGLVAGLLAQQPLSDLGAARAFVYLSGNASVAGAQIRLGQVADISGFDEDLIEELEEMPLGQAPLPGESLTIERNEIRRQMANRRIDAVRVAIAGGNSVTVERRGRMVSNDEVTALVDNWVADSWRGEDVRTELMFTRLPDELTLKEEQFDLRVLDSVKPKATGSMALSVAALDGDRVLARFPVSIRLRAWQEVIVAADDLKRGSIISEEDIRFNEQEMSNNRGRAYVSVDEVLGKRLVRTVRAGDIITSGHVENPPLIERGDEIFLVVEFNGIRVGCSGKAAQKGGYGDHILVRNQYGRNLTGVVMDAHTVMITK
jgi:flagella basal body P-ring formation protein FlgA